VQVPGGARVQEVAHSMTLVEDVPRLAAARMTAALIRVWMRPEAWRPVREVARCPASRWALHSKA
jgi:hypothetical protein